VTFTLTQPGDYTVAEETPEGWTPLGPTSYNFTAASGMSYGPYDFKNYEHGEVTACKVDSEGLAIEGWRMTVDGQEGYTGTDGCVTFTLTQPGDYTLSEESRDGWTHLDEATWPFTAKSGESYSHTFTNFQHANLEACKVDSEGFPVEGWKMTVDGQEGFTGTDGCVDFTLTQPGDYTLVEESRDDWTHLDDTFWVFTAKSGGSYSHTFTNFQHATVVACKEDHNGQRLNGWMINLHDGTGLEIAEGSTHDNGCVTFSINMPGDYSLSEDLLPDWIQLAPETGIFAFTVTSGYQAEFTFVNATPSIDINKQIKAYEDGSWEDNLEVIVGTPLYYQFVVTNDGPLDLQDVAVTDPTLSMVLNLDPETVLCEIPTLAVGESVTCAMFGPVPAVFTASDKMTNIAYTEGCTVSDPEICADDDDPASYKGLYWAFTPGFWKTHWGNPEKPNQKDAWQYTAYQPTDLACSSSLPGISLYNCDLSDLTLLDVLKPQTFKKQEGYSQLLRAGTAALLNASFHEVNHGDIYGPGDIVYFPLYSSEVIALVNEALASEDITIMLELAALLDSYNNGLDWINWGDGGPLP
jgi:hypothetical protein